jgi:hypothetical protein
MIKKELPPPLPINAYGTVQLAKDMDKYVTERDS